MKRVYTVLMVLVLLMTGGHATYSQSEPERLSFGFNAGGVKYWGEFTDNQFWLGGDLFFRYNIFKALSIHASAGMAQIRYKTDADAIGRYPDYFGAGAKKGDFYPNISDKTKISDVNSIRVNTYEIYASLNIFPTQSFVPYVFAGVGLMNWEPKSGDTGFEGSLPNNINNVYEKQKLIYPVGIGFEAYLTDNLVLNGKGTMRLTGTDYLDDYMSAGSENDAFLTFGLGFSYYILGDVDYDKDGLSNSREKELTTDPQNPDTDGDGLKDGAEVYEYFTDPKNPDTDGDGLNDYDEVFTYRTSPIKADSDADGLKDGEEIARKTNALNPDTDDDRLLDGEEVAKYFTDPLDKDTDADSLTDGEEVLKYNTNPKAKDTDNDGLTDGEEVSKYDTNPTLADSDSDVLNDGQEILTYNTDPKKPDSDGDMLLDGEEVSTYKTNPLLADTDSDKLSDGDEVKKYLTNPLLADSDTDNLTDGDEVLVYKTNPAKADTDADLLADGLEVITYKTDPLKADTDGDMLVDGDEALKYKTNPLMMDTDSDELNDGIEVTKTFTDPLNPDTDSDTIIDGKDDCPLIAGIASNVKGKNGCPVPPKIGTKTDFPDILFIVDTDEFNFDNPSTGKNLAKLLEYVKQCDGLEVMIEGHASAEGNKARNKTLSDMRAKKVKVWLIEQGVNPNKIGGTIGYGSSQEKVKEPTSKKALKAISKEDLEAIRKQNRRITVAIMKTCS